ncbi:ephrin type-B receptor 1-B-like [Clytia hemisphaerica]|uniref:receptor protein-tyrosine kinase n=1 Tax=Clytia hemisphaerica TaxID=252671 RepID=A0A7M5WJ64_9CNID
MGLCQNILIFTSLLHHLSSNKVFISDVFGRKGFTEDWNKDNDKCVGTSSWYLERNDKTNPKFQVCFSRYCFLESTSYPITSVNTIYADAKFTGRYCNALALPNPDCGENITVNAIILDTFPNTKTHNTPTEQEVNLPVMDDLKVPIPQKDGKPSFFEAKQTITYDNKLNKKYIRYLFDSKMGCGSISGFEIYYYKCPSATSSLAVFGVNNAPSLSDDAKEYEGKCVDNAVEVGNEKLTMKCAWNGTVQSITGQCVCLKGYEKENNQCKICDSQHFKPTQGNEKCTRCGLNSRSSIDKTTCNCLHKYKREVIEINNPLAVCYKIPDVPSAISFSNITRNSVEITWSHPSQINKTNIYIVDCNDCPSGVFPKTTTDKFITINGLGAFADYEISVTFSSEVSRMIGENQTSKFESFKTLPGPPGKVRNLRQKSLDGGKVELSWDPPFAKGGNLITYLLTYGGSTKKTTLTTYIIESDAEDQTFTVKIAAQVSVGGQLLTGESSTFKDKISVKGGVALDMAIGVGVGVVLLVIIIAIIAFYIYRKKHPPYAQAVRLENGQVELKTRFLSFPGSKLYVDPMTYGAVDEAVQEFAFELDQKSLTIGQLLGGGEFADVYKGTLFKNGKSKEVAIKTLKQSATKHDRDDFLSEAAIVGQFTDPNVISLEGVVLKERPNVIVLEYMANGSLDKYLQKHDMQLTNLQLLGMARGVASGMKYLNELGFIHRDLAARNILVDEYRVCKVSDFGMSREIKVDETYDTQGGKIPVRWTAPESIQYKKFTTASDAWSYGILLWEIMSYGERPYWDWGNYEVLERLNQGYRLPPPMNCPKVIHDLMLHCWKKDRTKRPRMVEIRDQIEKWIRSPDLLETTVTVVTKTDENLDYTVLQTINKWLDAIGMAKYTENFIEKGYATPRQILSLTLEDLEELGIAPIGHRKKIFKAIQNTKQQVEQRHNSVSVGTGGRKKTFSLPKKGGAS